MDLICCFPSTFYRFLPTSWNREIWNLKREMEILMKEVIQERRDLVNIGRIESYGNDLLGLMLREGEGKQCDNRNDNNNNNTNGTSKSNHTKQPYLSPKFTIQQIMDECKTFFFAGHETSAGLLTWTMVLLASNPEWQEKAREEVIDVLGKSGVEFLEAESLHKLKIVCLPNQFLIFYMEGSLFDFLILIGINKWPKIPRLDH